MSTLMSKGERIKAFPVHMVHMQVDEIHGSEEQIKVAFSAPKRIHRSAPNRNLLKRRMREAFRPFIPELRTFVDLQERAQLFMFIYVGSEKLSSTEITEKINLLLNRFQEQHKIPGTDEKDEEHD